MVNCVMLVFFNKPEFALEQTFRVECSCSNSKSSLQAPPGPLLPVLRSLHSREGALLSLKEEARPDAVGAAAANPGAGARAGA